MTIAEQERNHSLDRLNAKEILSKHLANYVKEMIELSVCGNCAIGAIDEFCRDYVKTIKE